MADTAKRDTENVPLDEDIDAYFAREVLPYNPEAWIDKSKTKVGYEIPSPAPSTSTRRSSLPTRSPSASRSMSAP
ncbi:hypothetical protein M5E87_05595 [Flavonifractor plautii]|nr:hypothetical protein M5E87_05595 [Flavonifractor plautii]